MTNRIIQQDIESIWFKILSSCCCEVTLVNVWPLDNQIKNKVWDFLHFRETAVTFTSLVTSYTMACDTQCSHSKLPHIALSDLRAKSHYWVSQQSTIRSAPLEHQQHRSSLLPRHKLSDRLLHSSLYSRHNTSPAYFLIGSCVKEGGSEIIYLNLAAV